MKRIKPILLAFIILLINSITANAIELNIKLGDYIIHNQDKLNILYEVYFSKESSVSQVIRGQDQNVFSMWLEAFNRENKGMIPIDVSDKISYISLGYNKKEVPNSPDSCQHITLTNVQSITILLTENGCSITK